MLELYSTLNPSIILFFIVLSVCGVIVQTLYFSVVTESKIKKAFEFLIGSHLIFVSLIFRKLNVTIGDVVILAEMYSTMRLVTAIFILILGLYIFVCEKNYHVTLAIFLVLITLPMAERLPYGMYTFCFILSLSALMFRAVILYIMKFKKQRTEITEYSIKEALDTQHSGILFAEKEGAILLINKQMLYLMKKITGKNCRNAENFWDTINTLYYTGPDLNVENSEPYNLICKLDDSSWQFLRKEIFYRGKKIYQITATDITEQEVINQKLEDYGNQLREQQEQLNIALLNLEELGREEAISRSWNYIHGVLGQHISALQRLLAQEFPLDIEELSLLVKKLQKDLIIKEENPEEIYRCLVSSFTSLDVNLHKEGEIPEDDKISNLFIEIIREGTTNALRHGQANNIYLVLSGEGKYTLTMTNDGVLSPEHIVWGGGLHSIYNKVKELGGSLVVDTRPRFSLYVEISK